MHPILFGLVRANGRHPPAWREGRPATSAATSAPTSPRQSARRALFGSAPAARTAGIRLAIVATVRRVIGSPGRGLFGGLLGSATGAAAGVTVTFTASYALGHAAESTTHKGAS